MSIDLEELAAIIEQLDQTEFTDFSYENGDLKIRVSRGGTLHEQPAVNGAPPSASVPAPEQTQAPVQAPAQTPQAAPVDTAPTTSGLDPNNLPDGHTLVTAPMLGTFYAAPKPGDPAFVNLGDTVAADSVVCIIEVMKLMNSVSAGTAGQIVEVFAKDGDLVEHGQPLFVIKGAA